MEKKSASILYLSYDGMTDPLGQSQVIPYLSGLSALGFSIQIISFEKPLAFEKNKDEIAATLTRSGIIWHPIVYSSRPPVLSTLYDIWKMRKKSRQLHHKYHFQIVHSRSYISALIGLYLKRKMGVRFVFDMRGFWANERVEGKIWNLRNPLYNRIFKYFKRKEIAFLSEADHIISLTHAAVPELKKISGTNSLHVTVIPCCADLDHFNHNSYHSSPIQQLKRKVGLNETDRVLSYLGSIGTWYMLDEMLLFFSIAKGQGVFTKFLFITKENADVINRKALQYGIEVNDIVVVSAERNEVPQLLMLSEANIFFIKPCFSKRASSPTKMAEVLGMGIPVITNVGVGDVQQQLEESGCGLFVKSFDKPEMEFVIGQIPDFLTKVSKEQCRQVALRFFDLQKGIDLYSNVYSILFE